MLQVALAQVRTHARRFVAVGLAVVMAVGFLTATLMVNASTEASLANSIGAGFLVAASQAGGAASRLVLGAASDRWATGRRPLWLAFTGAVGAVIFLAYAVWPASTPIVAGVLAFATGVGAYGWVGIFFVISAEAGGRDQAGLLSGVAFAAIVLGLLAGPPLFGVLLERFDSYAIAWAVFAALSALASLGSGLTLRHFDAVRCRNVRPDPGV